MAQNSRILFFRAIAMALALCANPSLALASELEEESCRSGTPKRIYEIKENLLTRAKVLLEELKQVRAMPNSSDKLSGYLATLKEAQALETEFVPIRNYLTKSFGKNDALYNSKKHGLKVGEKITRVRSALEEMQKNTSAGSFSAQERHDAEFSLNGLVTDATSYFEKYIAASDSAEKQWKLYVEACDRFLAGGEYRKVGEFRLFLKESAKSLFVGYGELLPRGKFNMSLTRIEMLNRAVDSRRAQSSTRTSVDVSPEPREQAPPPAIPERGTEQPASRNIEDGATL
jgi:hypothetical protein